MSVPSRSKMSASGTQPSLTGGCATRLKPFARGAYEGERLVPVKPVRTDAADVAVAVERRRERALRVAERRLRGRRRLAHEDRERPSRFCPFGYSRLDAVRR